MDPDKIELSFQKKLTMTGDEREPCLARKVCRLEHELRKIKLSGYETIIGRCDLYLE